MTKINNRKNVFYIYEKYRSAAAGAAVTALPQQGAQQQTRAVQCWRLRWRGWTQTCYCTQSTGTCCELVINCMQYEARRFYGPPGYPPSRLCPLTSMHYMRYFCRNRMLLPSGEYRRNSETQFCGAELSSVDNTTSLGRSKKTNFWLIVYSSSFTNPAHSAKIGPVDFFR